MSPWWMVVSCGCMLSRGRGACGIVALSSFAAEQPGTVEQLQLPSLFIGEVYCVRASERVVLFSSALFISPPAPWQGCKPIGNALEPGVWERAKVACLALRCCSDDGSIRWMGDLAFLFWWHCPSLAALKPRLSHSPARPGGSGVQECMCARVFF